MSTPRFLYAAKLENVSVVGTGMIDGNGSAWWSESSTSSHPYLVINLLFCFLPFFLLVGFLPQSNLVLHSCFFFFSFLCMHHSYIIILQIYFYHCTNVDFFDITLINSPKLTLVPKPSDNVRIYNVPYIQRTMT